MLRRWSTAPFKNVDLYLQSANLYTNLCNWMPQNQKSCQWLSIYDADKNPYRIGYIAYLNFMYIMVLQVQQIRL